MLDFLKECEQDASSFLNGTSRLFPDFLVDDDRLTALVNFDSDEVKFMLKQCLELLFGGFVSVTERMLSDHLVDGKYADHNEDLCRESKAVPTTNTNPQSDFGMLDRLMKLKPKALEIVYESMIMFTRNNTSDWRDSLSKEDLAKAMKFASDSKDKQKDLFFKRKVAIHNTRAEKLKNLIEEKERKELALFAEKEKLTHQLEEAGGLWADEAAAIKQLALCKSEKEKRTALKIQLTF